MLGLCTISESGSQSIRGSIGGVHNPKKDQDIIDITLFATMK